MAISKAKSFEFFARSADRGGGRFGNVTAKLGLVLIAALLGASCTGVRTKKPNGEPVLMNQEEFSAYVEHVFRHHNTVVNESLFVSPSEVGGVKDSVSNAERYMDHACQPLNDLASASAAGLNPDFWTKMKLAEAVPDCEAATQNLERLFSQSGK